MSWFDCIGSNLEKMGDNQGGQGTALFSAQRFCGLVRGGSGGLTGVVEIGCLRRPAIDSKSLAAPDCSVALSFPLSIFGKVIRQFTRIHY
jgi:hypothetical protein